MSKIQERVYFITREHVEQIREFSKDSKRIWIASPFISGYGYEALDPTMQSKSYGKDIRFLVNATSRFYSDPAAIRTLISLGQVRSHSGFHAKLYIFSKAAIVTSANLTKEAFERNIEAGVVIKDIQLINRIAAEFEDLWNQSYIVTDTDIARLEAEPLPPRTESSTKAGKGNHRHSRISRWPSEKDSFPSVKQLFPTDGVKKIMLQVTGVNFLCQVFNRFDPDGQLWYYQSEDKEKYAVAINAKRRDVEPFCLGKLFVSKDSSPDTGQLVLQLGYNLEKGLELREEILLEKIKQGDYKTLSRHPEQGIMNRHWHWTALRNKLKRGPEALSNLFVEKLGTVRPIYIKIKSRKQLTDYVWDKEGSLFLIEDSSKQNVSWEHFYKFLLGADEDANSWFDLYIYNAVSPTQIQEWSSAGQVAPKAAQIWQKFYEFHKELIHS